jgi:glycosylphosphatidylinositol transamidase (GPIT) subunit GPI8
MCHHVQRKWFVLSCKLHTMCNIILMLAEDVACNPRNAYPGQVRGSEGSQK